MIIIELALAFLVSIVVTALVIPCLLNASFSSRMLDHPNSRKIHKGDVPRIGGMAISVSVLLSALVMWVIKMFVELPGLETYGTSLGCLGGAGAVMLLFGLVDDVVGLRYRAKFVGQIMAALLLCASGLWVKDFCGIVGVNALPQGAGWAVTVLAVLLVTNAVNFIDGIDGLASGLCILALCYYTALFASAHMWLHAACGVVVVGALLPFLWYNMRGTAARHNKIFLGDTGSLMLGLLMCAMGVAVSNARIGGGVGLNPMVVAFAPLILPCYDVVRVVCNRCMHGHNMFVADKGHIHHKFLALHMPQRHALLCVLTAAVAMTASAVALSRIINVNAVLVIEAVIWAGINMVITKLIKKQNNNDI